MKPNILPIFLLCAISLFPACSKPKGPTWQSFQPPGGRFAVELPGDPIADPPETTRTEVVIKWHIVSTLSGISGLSIGYSDGPSRSAETNQPAVLLAKVRDQSISDLNGEHLKQKDKPISLKAPQGADLPGMEFQVSIKSGFVVRERIYLVGTRIYALMVVAGSPGVSSADAERFFNSFRILP